MYRSVGFELPPRLLHHFDGHDAGRFERRVGTVGRHGLKLVDHGLGLVVGDLAEDRVVSVEPRGRHGGDEELGAVGAMRLAVAAATQAGVRHGQQIRPVECEFGDDLVVEVVAGAAGAIAQRAAALDHEVLDDAVEGQAVVERLMGRLAGEWVRPFLLAGRQTEEVLHGHGRLIVEQVDGDVTFGGAHDDGSHGPKCLMGLRPGGDANQAECM